MFDKKQIVRNVAFAFFCALILMISLTLTYYITFYDEEKATQNLIKKTETEKNYVMNDNSKTTTKEVCDPGLGYLNLNFKLFSPTYFVNSLFFKLSVAFFAGCLASDGFYIKMGVI